MGAHPWALLSRDTAHTASHDSLQNLHSILPTPLHGSPISLLGSATGKPVLLSHFDGSAEAEASVDCWLGFSFW